jgi:predicted DsbA family dithiol-disulfide isomerase
LVAIADELTGRAQELGLDQDKVRELLAGCRDEDGNIDWDAAIAKAQEMGVDKVKSLLR